MARNATVSLAASGIAMRITWPRLWLSHRVSTRYHGSSRAPAMTTWAMAAPTMPIRMVR